MVQNDPTALQCHSISLSNSLTKEDVSPEVEKVLPLCKTTFDPDNAEPIRWPFQLDEWLLRLELPSSQALYATKKDDSRPQGFVLTFPRTHPEIGYETYHISLAAVDASARGLGIFPLLLEHTRDHAKNAGFKELSICTYPARFPKMFRILSENGWELVAWRKEDDGDKVLMRMKI